MTSKPDARPDDRKRKNTWQHLSVDSPALDTGEVGTEFLMNLMYMLAGVYTTSNTMTRLKKLLWNIFPFLAHCQCLQNIVLVAFVLRQYPFITIITTVLQSAMFLVNSATFYRSRRLGSVSRDIPRKTQRAAFIWGIAVCSVPPRHPPSILQHPARSCALPGPLVRQYLPIRRRVHKLVKQSRLRKRKKRLRLRPVICSCIIGAV